MAERAARGVRSFVACAAAAVSLAALITTVWNPRPILVWNVSESAPTGLYALSAAGQARLGDTVAAWPPKGARELASARGYLPSNVPLIKTVAAASGDRVCASQGLIRINGHAVAERRSSDSFGRELPRWTGCITLVPGQYFLLMAASAGSFDGRYFGPSNSHHILGKARLLWRL